MSKKTICSKCDGEIGVYVPYSTNIVGDSVCIPCASILWEQQIKKEREIEYYKPNICVRCHTKITGPFYSDCKPNGTRAGGNICSPCVAIEDSKIIDVVSYVVREVN